MKLSIVTSEYWYKDMDDMLKTLHEAGFEALDYCGENLGRLSQKEEEEYCKKLTEKCKEYGIEIYQTHAPFLINKPEEEFLGEAYKNSVIAAIERTARLGVKYIVIHPYCPQGLELFINARPYDYSKFIDHNKEVNLQCFKQFVPYLKKYGIIMCIENLFAYDVLMQRHVASSCSDPDEINYYIDELGEDTFGACYDSGHLNHFGGDEENFITKLGARLKVVHFNDSWGKDFYGMDWHLMPGQGDVDWMKVKASLDKIGYKGTANFEVGPRKGVFFKPQLKYIAEVGNAIFNEEKGENI